MPSRTRNAAIWIGIVLVVWLVVEGGALIAYRVTNGSWFSYSTARAELSSAAPSTSSDFVVRGLEDLRMGDFAEALHPYFGFVADARQNKPEWKVSEFGFPLSTGGSPLEKKAANKVIIGVFGGSFTQWVYLSLRSLLETRGAADGKKYVVLNFGIGGHKQPQQLMILNYLLTLGAEFDVVINIDGFNEVALPVIENIPNHVHPSYPRAWDKRTADAINGPTLRLIGLREETKQKKQAWARSFQEHHLYLSPTLLVLWQARDRALARAIFRLTTEMGTQAAAARTASNGPGYEPGDATQVSRDLVEIWKRSSIQMKNLCEANGIRYYHFLQPNQYLAGSKPMGADEVRKAINPASPYKTPVEQGYPQLTAAVADLQKSGVSAVDLTQIYANHPEPLYTDDCCHTNTRGSDIVAERILEIANP